MGKDLLRKLTIADKMGLFLVIVLGLMALMAYAYFDQELASLQDEFFQQQALRVEARLQNTAARAAARGAAAWRAELQDAMLDECGMAGGIVSRIHISVPGELPLVAGEARVSDRTLNRELPGIDGRPVRLAISLSAAGFSARTSLFRSNLFYGALLVVSLGVFLIAALIIHLLRPLLRLAESVQRIQAGDLGTRCPVDRPDEVGRLATAFNDMMGNLQEKEDTMMSAYDALNGTYMQLEAVLETLPAALVGCDAAQHVSVVNRSFLELFRLERDEILGEPLPELLARAAPQLAQPAAAAAAGTRAGRQLTEVDGRPWQLEIFAADGAAGGGRVLLLTPLTEADPHDAARRGFLNRLSQELRSPLTVVKSTLDAVKDGHLPKLPLDVQICLRMAANQTDQLCRLVNNLIALAEGERMAGGREEVVLAEVLEQALAPFGDELERKNIVVRKPDGASPRLPARRDWLALALENVIGNAVEYAPEGSELAIAWRDNGISVSDQGPGIAPALREHVFTPFAARAGREAGEGSGVGLAATRRALELMGWEISLTDGDDGRGTRVTMAVRG